MNGLLFDRSPEEHLFEREGEGWIFVLDGRWAYLVNDAQKAELLARLERWRFVPSVLLPLIVVALLLLSGSSEFSDWLQFAISAAIAAAACFLFFAVVMPYIQLLILRPILVGARPATVPPRPTRVGSWHLSVSLQRQAQTWSLRGLVLVCGIFGWLSVKSGYAAFTLQGSYLDTFTMALLTVYFGAVLAIKLKRR